MANGAKAVRGNVRERILEAGLARFGIAGFNATGVKEIVDLAGVPKGSFYAYFSSKEALGCAVIDRYWQMAFQDNGGLHDLSHPPLERLRRHFAELSAVQANSKLFTGCLLGRLSAEVAGQSELMRERLSQRFQDWAANLVLVIREIEEAGALVEGVTPDEAAQYMINGWEGAAIRLRADNSTVPLKLFEKLAFKALFRDAGSCTSVNMTS